MSYQTALICLNGHMIDDSIELSLHYGHSINKFCKKCGARGISECQHCHTPIQGHYLAVNVLSLSETPVPAYCHNCGKPYPWTEALINEAEKIVSFSNELTDDEVAQLKKYIPDLLIEQPHTISSALATNKILDKAGNGIKSAFKAKFADILTTKALEFIFPELLK